MINNLIKEIEKNKYWKIIIDIIINWNIPYLMFIRKYLVFISLYSLIIFFNPRIFKDLWELWMNLLIIILFLSPLSKLFPKFKILNKLLILKRPVWIIIWSFIIAHIIWFLMINHINIIKFISTEIFNYKNQLFWWLWWAIFMLLPLITSNNLSQKILKNKWKILQQFTYLFFIFWSIHVFLIKWHPWKILIIFIWMILKYLAYKKVIILK